MSLLVTIFESIDTMLKDDGFFESVNVTDEALQKNPSIVVFFKNEDFLDNSYTQAYSNKIDVVFTVKTKISTEVVDNDHEIINHKLILESIDKLKELFGNTRGIPVNSVGVNKIDYVGYEVIKNNDSSQLDPDYCKVSFSFYYNQDRNNTDSCA